MWNAPRVVIPPPPKTPPVSPCKPLCARFRAGVACVPAFAHESERGPFVREVEKRDERWSEIELLLIVGATENREMYVYKSMVKSRVTNAHHIIHSVLTGSRSPAGPRRLGTATRISASLFRRLSAFFRSVSDQDPKAAKFAVLPPGHAGFPQRVKQSEGSDTTPHPKRPMFHRVSRCVRSFSESRVCTRFRL